MRPAELVRTLREVANGDLSKLKTASGDYGLCDDAAQAIIEAHVRFKKYSHTTSSMIVMGTYLEGITTKADVERLVKGSWGGRFESFNNGHFRYVAYTD